MKRVLVIVATHNGMKWIPRCLGSVAQDADLFVIDDVSSDGSADYVASAFPGAKLVRNTENQGFTGTNNAGMEYALGEGYDYVYLLNQDAWLLPGALLRLVEFADAHPEYGLLSPMQMTADTSVPDRNFAKALGGKTLPSSDVPVVDVPFVMAAHWLIPCRALKKTGLFSPLFPMYGQDDDWCNRARYHGYRIGVVPGAVAVHDRAYRKEAMERVIYRNFYMGSLVRLADVNRPLWERRLFVLLFAVVKAFKYGSMLPIRYLRQIRQALPAIREHRSASKKPLQ